MKNLRTELMLYFSILIIIILTLVGTVSYYWNKKAIGLKVTESTVESLKQIDKNMLMAFGEIEDLSLFVISNEDIRTYLKRSNKELLQYENPILKLNEAFVNLTNTKSYILSVNVYGNNGLNFETAGPSAVDNEKLIQSYEGEIPQDGNCIFTQTYIRNFQILGSQYVISLYRQLNDINNFKRRLGIIRIDLNERELNKTYKDMKLGDTGYIFVADKEGRVISHSDVTQLSKDIKSQEPFNHAFEGGEGYYRKKYMGKDLLIAYYTSKKQNLVYISVVPFRELLEEVDTSLGMTVILIVIVSTIALTMVHLMSLKIVKPIKKLTKLMQEVEEGNLNVLINIKRKDEIGTLGRSFNSMTVKLKNLIEEVYKIQISIKEAELKALQSQINPHFLYNTLDVIYWTSRLEKATKTGEIVVALAAFFKLGLNKGNEMTTVGKEVMHLENYLIIQKFRYDEAPELIIDVDPELFNCKIIKLTLQPLVENALVHGIAGLQGKGSVKVIGRQAGEDIQFEVIDNGVGIDPEQLIKLLGTGFDEKDGYGIRNVDQRIKLYFGEQYGIEIFSEKGNGTRVAVTVPKMKDQ